MRLRVVAAVLAGLVVLVLAVVLLRPDPAPSAGPSAPIATRGPVLLIPGYGGATNGFGTVAATLGTAGVPTEVVDIGDGRGDLTAYASQVVKRASELVAQGAPSVDLVGYSAGGLIARDAATRSDGRALIRAVVTVGTPHEGTELASLGALFGDCPTACQQLTPGSDYLKALSPADSVERWLSIWSTTDEVIRPVTSSELSGARWFPLQEVCARDVQHNQLISDPLVVGTTSAFLAGSALPTRCLT